MLATLKIKNYALIDLIEVDFKSGLNIITGETGAGKSIIMEAIELLIGDRADSKILKNKEEKCIIEGEFSIGSYGLESFFTANEIDYSENCIIRREINQQGKSRAFINDTPVTLTILRQLSEQLIDIHSQHETLDIGKSLNQLEMLDGYAGIESLVKKYAADFSVYQETQKKLTELLQREQQSKLDLDYFLFQYNELEEAALKPGQFTEQEQELKLLSHSEEIKSVLDQSMKVLDNDVSGLLNELKSIRTSIHKVSAFHPSLQQLNERLNAVTIELKDIYDELSDLNDDVNYDPEKIQLLNDRINLLSGLMQKHRVNSDRDLVLVRDDLKTKIDAIGSLENEIALVQQQATAQKEKLIAQAAKLTAERKKTITPLEKNIHTLLAQLSMPHAELQIEWKTLEEPTSYGMDKISFLFKTNKGGSFQELNKIASGGEFSRLMLALKSIIAKVKSLPTIVFDEIDTGVSGEVAHKMGAIMREMGLSMQVFCITHLPQVAGKGNAHYKVFKVVEKKQTSTRMEKLDQHKRIEEVAKMLSGEKLSDAAMANAKELIVPNES